MTPAPLLVLGVGNPSRGDDALGPCFVERAAAALAGEVAAGRPGLLPDFQLRLGTALARPGRRRVIFVDASVGAAPPFELTRIEPRPDPSATSHAMSPAAVLQAHRDVIGEPPEAWVLAIRGERFELGDGLSASAGAHLDAALTFFAREACGATAIVDGRRLELEGTVQGVGLRPWLARAARALVATVRDNSKNLVFSSWGVSVAAVGWAAKARPSS